MSSNGPYRENQKPKEIEDSEKIEYCPFCGAYIDAYKPRSKLNHVKLCEREYKFEVYKCALLASVKAIPNQHRNATEVANAFARDVYNGTL